MRMGIGWGRGREKGRTLFADLWRCRYRCLWGVVLKIARVPPLTTPSSRSFHVPGKKQEEGQRAGQGKRGAGASICRRESFSFAFMRRFDRLHSSRHILSTVSRYRHWYHPPPPPLPQPFSLPTLSSYFAPWNCTGFIQVATQRNLLGRT